MGIIKSIKLIILIISIGSWIPSGLMAQVEGDSIGWHLDPVVVTGTRMEQPKRKVASSVTVISRRDIEKNGNINVLPSLSRHVPGFFLNNRSITGFGVGPNSGGNVSMRGISGSPNNRILILIDGQPQYMGIFAHPIADSYHSSDIERVEVIRGASSVLYGSNAMGGAINLITRKADKEGLNGNFSLGYGSYGTALLSGNARFRKEKFHAMVAVNRSQTDGYRPDAEDGFENTSTFVKLGYDINNVFSVSADFQLADAIYFQPGPTDDPLENDQREYLRGRAALSLKNKGEKISGAVLFYHNFGDHVFASGFESKDQNQGITAYQNLHLVPGQTITVGLDHNRFGGNAANENLPPPARIGLGTQHWVSQTDIYLHLQQTVLERFNFNVGVREINNSQFGSHTVPAFGLTYEVGPNTTFKVASSKAFRSPSVVDLFLFPPSNEELDPEVMWNHELGWVQQTADQKWVMELSLFYIKGDNLIQINPMETPPIGRNSGTFKNMGLETQIRFQPESYLDLMVNYSFVDVSENVLFAPRHNFTAQVDWEWGKFSFLPSLQQIYGLRNSMNPDSTLENYSLLNLRTTYQIAPAVQLYADANNLFDAKYQVERGYPMPGINLVGGINFNF